MVEGSSARFSRASLTQTLLLPLRRELIHELFFAISRQNLGRDRFDLNSPVTFHAAYRSLRHCDGIGNVAVSIRCPK